MFEEDFERCFICQQPSRGLYCSSECRMKDKGTASPAFKAQGVPPVRLTSQLPATLSPAHRATQQLGPSPKMPPHVPPRGADSSSSSSITSSPIQSPRTNPGSGSDSPQKDPINLPPPAYPRHHSNIGFPGSVPVKIPKLIPKPTNSPATAAQPESHGTSLFGIGNSIDTLRFGRKPGMVNSVTSPNALTPRCACGKPAGHAQRRASSKERLEAGVAALSLGPSLVNPIPLAGGRVFSNPAQKASRSGHGTPDRNAAVSADLEHHTVSSTLNGSLLARSYSDPIPPSPKDVRPSLIAPFTRQHPSANLPAVDSVPAPSSSGRAGGAHSPRRGRSVERQSHRLELSEVGPLNQSREREQAPSRSRHRRDERPERMAQANQSSAGANAAFSSRPVYANAAEADWTRRSPSREQVGEGIVPPSRRQDAGDRGKAGYGLRLTDL